MPDSNASAPAVRGFQFDSGAIGNLKNSVNLFRGDVNFHQSLLHLTARPGKQELDVDVSLLYQSNIHDQTQRWNRDAATGVLGLGWEMPMEGIGMYQTAALSQAHKRYYYQVNGSKNDLIRELGSNPFRFNMSNSYSPTSGQPIGSGIQAQFADHGIVISAEALATTNGEGSWLISDDTNQQLFQINTAGDQLAVHDGGESYQLKNYQFWKILYYPVYERWVVVRESGVSYAYGGFNPDSDQNKNGYNYSTGNSVAWAVAWTDPNQPEQLLWTGSSHVCGNNSQKQYAKGWWLTSITDRWGDQVRYAYNQFGPNGDYASYSEAWRDETADLIPVVEQQVGANGLPYTKATYLTSITDSFGRQVIFNYGDKEYTAFTGSASAAAAREYLDPHRELSQQVVASDPDTWPSPNAYQDSYETKYLASIQVQNASAEPLFSIGFSYQPVVDSYADYASDDRLYGDTVKRQLKGITQYNEVGQTLLQNEGPELLFQYQDLSMPNPGALANITYPDGGVASYSYELQALDICDRKITISPPAELGSAASPRVFYGEDYVVSLWTNSALTKLSMRVYTWLGHWEVWQVDDLQSGSLLYDNPEGSIHVSGSSGNLLNVKTAGEYFVVSFSDGKQVQAYAFSKSLTQPGQWNPYLSEGEQTICNHPSISWPASSTVNIAAGGSWFLATETTASQRRNLSRYTYRWATHTGDQWQRNQWGAERLISDTTDVLYLGTGSDCYFLLRYADGHATASLQWFDSQLQWQAGGSQELTDFNLPQQNNAISIMGQSFAVFSNQTRNPSSTYVYYDVRVFQWDEDYQFIDLKWNGDGTSTTTPMSLQDRIGKKDATPSIVPTVVANSLFACAGNVFRFDGQTWWSRTAAEGLPIDQHASYVHYAYGEDYAVQGWVDNTTPQGNLLAYDPNNNGGDLGWDNTAVAVQDLPAATPAYDPGNSNWATAGNSDYLTVGANVYYRDCAANWQTQVSAAGYTISPAAGFQVNSAAMNDQAPSFMAYFEYQQGALADATVGALLLKNGQVNSSQEIPGERYYTTLESSGQPGNGLYPSGPNSLVTYPDSSPGFQDAANIYLYRYAGQALTGPITHRPVVSIEIDDGLSTTATAYAYDTRSAACDASGQVVKYYQAKSYPGCSQPAAQQNGYKNQQYINGLIALTIDNLPDGAVVSWNDGGGEHSHTASQAADSITINNVTNTVLQSLTLNTPQAVTLDFTYGTTEFSQQYTVTNTTVPMFETLPAAPINNFQMLDGMLWRTQTYGHTAAGFELLASQQNTWQPYTYRAGDLLDPAVPDGPLNGGLVLQTGQQNMADGSLKTAVTGYLPPGFTAPTTGQPVVKSLTYLDGDGRQQQSTETTTYAYQVYAAFRCLHGLTAVAQKVTRQNEVVSAATADAFATATASTAVTVPAKAASFKFASGEFSDFPFASYDPEQPQTWQQWQRNNQITVTNPQGMVVNSQDAAGVNHGLLYDRLHQYTVASVSNGYVPAAANDTVMAGATFPVGEAAYNGFESYEDQSGWLLAGGAVIAANGDNSACDCHTGDRSLTLPDGGSLSRTIAVTDDDQTYLLSFWYKTADGFADHGLQVSNSENYASHPAAAQFSATGGQWCCQTVALEIPAHAAEELTITWQNHGGAELLMDDVVIMPLQSELGSHVYDPVFMYVAATNVSPGRTSRLLRNRFHQLTANVNFSDQVTDLSVDYYARQQGDQFNPIQPNAKLKVSASAAGVAADFKDGGTFAEQFEITNLASHWQPKGDRLIHDSNDSDQVTSPVFNCAEPVTAVALYLELSATEQQAISQPFSLSVGAYRFTWTPATQQWSGSGPVVIDTVNQSHTPRNILLLRGNGVVVLFSDGQLIGSYTEQVSGEQITFDTGANQLQIDQLIACANPRLQLEFYDGTSKLVQTQLLHGQDSYVTQTLYDEVGRDVVVTKAMPFSFQNNHGSGGQAQPVLQFRQGVVDAAALLPSLQGSGVMTGDVADFYRGDSAAVQAWQQQVSSWPGPIDYSFTPTNDAGYPYSRKRYEASPLARVVEKGQPGTLGDGTLLAIDMQLSAEQRHTTQYQFGYHSSQFILPEPFVTQPSAYQIVSEILPLKSRQVQVQDQQDNVVATLIYDQGALNPRQQTQNVINYSSQGSSTINRLPNYFSADPARQSNHFTTTLVHDLLGQLIEVQEADTGQTRMMYDALGRLRFEMPDQDNQDNPVIKYTCYNNLSQVVCNGTLAANDYPWDSLAAHVDDPDWPSAAISQRSRELSYNDPGDSQKAPPVNQLGQLIEVQTHNHRVVDDQPLTLTVCEHFTYDIQAAVLTTTQRVTEQVGSNSNPVGPAAGYAVSYQYNNLQQLLTTTYPDGVGDSQTHRYDELGRTSSNHYGTQLLCDYQYTAGENPASLNLQSTINGTVQPVETINYQYNSPEMLQSGAVQNGQNIGIKVGNYSYNANGRVLSKAIQFALNQAETGQVQSYDTDQSYRYDEAVDRLHSSTDNHNPAATISDLSYDDNGNVLSLSEAGQTITWSFADNNDPASRTDLLAGISTSATAIQNNAAGQMTQAPNNGSADQTNVISYDASLGLTASIAYDDQSELVFAYGSQGQRVLKRNQTAAGSCDTLYVSPGSHYLSEIELAEEQPAITNYVYGAANQLLGVTVNDQIRFPVSDQLGTVLAWVDASKQLISSYQFLPFGKLIAQQTYGVESGPVIFAGQPYEAAVGLYDFRGRFYDPQLRRFISPDPERQFASPFVYVGNDPVSYVDPSGEMSADAVGGIILSSLEITFAIATMNYWAVPIGVAGLTNSISHQDAKGKAFWKNYAYSEIGVAVGVAEVAAGVALTVVTDGAGGAMGGAALIGAGISGISYSTFHEGDFDWGDYAKAQVIGAVGGLITGGFGAVGGALSSSIASEAALLSARGVAGLAVEGLSGIAGGAVSSLTGTAISAAWDQQSINWKSALINAGVSGALGVVGVGGSRMAKGAFKQSIQDFDGDGAAKASGFRKFIAGKNGDFTSRNAAGNIRPNPTRIANLAKPAAFNAKKPVVDALNVYYPKTNNWI